MSCATATSCFAVGPLYDPDHGLTGASGPMIERWNGTTWSTVAAPKPANTVLSAVSCPSPASCLAVGSSNTAQATHFHAFAERWDGTKWSVVTVARPTGSTFDSMSGVSCSGPKSCFAVGGYSPGGRNGRPLVEHWDGARWSVTPSPRLDGSEFGELDAVSCPSATSCVAVGSAGATFAEDGFALAEIWNGKHWAIHATPGAPLPDGETVNGQGPALLGVSCTSATDCFAVGHTAAQSLIEHWNGSGWSIVTSPAAPGSSDQIIDLGAVSCAGTNDCFAVGQSFQISVANEVEAAPTVSIAEHWNGKAWSIVARPKDAPVSNQHIPPLGRLTGVSCPKSTSCAAVGNSTLAERWDGTRWSIAPLVESSSFSRLVSVACPGPASCFAVGSAAGAIAGIGPLAEQWDGTAWSQVAVPSLPGRDLFATLSSVSCASTTSCTAVGQYSRSTDFSSTIQVPLVEEWNGSSWTTGAAATPAKATSSTLTGVSCPIPTDCTAVGVYFAAGSAAQRPLAEHWNGQRWSIVTFPGPAGAQDVVPSAVSCTSSTSCDAVGFSATATTAKTLAEHWNGAKWAVVPTPNPSGVPWLSAVSCPTATSCTAVGSVFSATTQRPLVERFDGKAWTIVASPAPSGATTVHLDGVSCTSASSCDAAGSAATGSAGMPLTEHWDGTSWAITSPALPAGATSAAVSGITCAPACTAVGSYSASTGAVPDSFTLVELGT